jgi:hypothetical protein
MDGYVKTDMNISDLVNLMNYARGLDPNKVDHLVLSGQYSTSYVTPNKEDAFLPVCSKIVPAIAQMFGLGNNAACNVTANSGNAPTLASAASQTPQIPQATQASALAANITSDPLQSLGPTQSQSLSALSVANGNYYQLGIHNILDLMFMVTFESLDASKV